MIVIDIKVAIPNDRLSEAYYHSEGLFNLGKPDKANHIAIYSTGHKGKTSRPDLRALEETPTRYRRETVTKPDARSARNRPQQLTLGGGLSNPSRD